MSISVSGPDGSSVDFPDGTDASTIHSVMAQHFGAGDDVTANKVVRSVATGVPVVGGLLNKADAATNAALAPVLNPLFDDKNKLKGDTFGERYANSLKEQNAG